jgi:hypothetical protein
VPFLDAIRRRNVSRRIERWCLFSAVACSFSRYLPLLLKGGPLSLLETSCEMTGAIAMLMRGALFAFLTKLLLVTRARLKVAREPQGENLVLR